MSDKLAFLYPGQGHIPEKLDSAAPIVRVLLERAASCGLPLASWLDAEETEKLLSTAAAQPIVYIDALSKSESLRAAGIDPDIVAGHSLGEYAALVCAGVLTREEGLDLVVRRGRLMSEVSGAMAAILKLPAEDVEQLCMKAGPHVVVANYNGPTQTVISGSEAGVVNAMRIAETQGGKAIRLNVSGPFHSPAMSAAEEAFAPSIESTAFRPSVIPLVSGVTGNLIGEPDELKRIMKRQITSPVQWTQVIRRLEKQGITQAVEVGAGKVLGQISRRITDRIRFLTWEEALDGGLRR